MSVPLTELNIPLQSILMLLIDSSFIPAPNFAVGLGPDAYEVHVDSLSITKFGTEIFRDEFDVGDPTWPSGSVGTYYGSGTESDGKLVLDSDDGFILMARRPLYSITV